MEFLPVIDPIIADDGLPSALFERRNEAFYASPTTEALDEGFEADSRVMIDYVSAWLGEIESQELIAERIGTKAFLK